MQDRLPGIEKLLATQTMNGQDTSAVKLSGSSNETTDLTRAEVRQ